LKKEIFETKFELLSYGKCQGEEKSLFEGKLLEVKLNRREIGLNGGWMV
jgi:hypothetical protein